VLSIDYKNKVVLYRIRTREDFLMTQVIPLDIVMYVHAHMHMHTHTHSITFLLPSVFPPTHLPTLIPWTLMLTN